MKDFKKFFSIFYYANKNTVKYSLIIYIILMGFFFINNLNQNQGNILYISSYVLGIPLFINALINAFASVKREFILSLPIENVKIYPISYLVYNLGVTLIFLLLICVNDLIFGSFIKLMTVIFLIALSIFICGLNLMFNETETSLVKSILSAMLYSSFFFIMWILSHANKTNLIVVASSVISIIVYVIGYVVFVRRMYKVKKNKAEYLPSVEYKKFNRLYSLQLLSFIDFTNFFNILPIILLQIYFLIFMNNDINVRKVFNYAIFMQLLIFVPLNYNRVKTLLNAVPFDPYKFIIKDKIFRASLFLVYLVICETGLFLFGTEHTQLKGFALCSLAIFCLGNIISPFSKYSSIPLALIIFIVTMSPLMDMFINLNLNSYVFALICISIYISSIFIYKYTKAHSDALL